MADTPHRGLVGCRVCGRAADTPMLKDELWAQVSPREEFNDYRFQLRQEGYKGQIRDVLCIECVEVRLGRTVYVEDLNDSLWSACMRAMVTRELARAAAKAGSDG